MFSGLKHFRECIPKNLFPEFDLEASRLVKRAKVRDDYDIDDIPSPNYSPERGSATPKATRTK